IAAPHTSNWDGVWALVYKVALGLDIRFFAKHSLFWFPLNILLRSLGGIALDRRRAGSAVQLAVQKFETEETFFFGLAPEGTRSLTPGWKTGFYRIAQQANVPVIPGFLDFGRRQIGLGEPYELTGDMDTDIAHFAALYADIEGRWPAKASPVRFTQ
ncbi:MAG: 1-acyl-sn-glycerol-3-phosphate acyltransferase, partial [Pseudomonadota bacterium]